MTFQILADDLDNSSFISTVCITTDFSFCCMQLTS